MPATVFIDLEAISQNIKIISELCDANKVTITAVTKGILANSAIIKILINNGINDFADSRLANLKMIRHYGYDCHLSLLRSPEIEEIEETIKIADCSFNSEINTICRISAKAVEKNIIHDIVLMVDLGDRREGFLPYELEKVINSISKLKNINIRGIGTNLGCISGIPYTKEKMEELCNLGEKVSRLLRKDIRVISGGSTGALNLLYNGQMPTGINNLRIGTALFLGSSQAGLKIPGLNINSFVLEAEIIELKKKPLWHNEIVGEDAFGNIPSFDNTGRMHRAILSIGRQDVVPESLIPKDDKVRFIAASSDHIVLDVTKSDKKYKVGDKIKFNMNYSAMLYLMNSDYVKKVYNK